MPSTTSTRHLFEHDHPSIISSYLPHILSQIPRNTSMFSRISFRSSSRPRHHSSSGHRRTHYFARHGLVARDLVKWSPSMPDIRLDALRNSRHENGYARHDSSRQQPQSTVSTSTGGTTTGQHYVRLAPGRLTSLMLLP